jgi:hypothetical protein
LAEARLYDLLGGMGAPANTVTVECRTHFCQYVVVSPGLEQLIEFQEIRNSTDFESAADLAAVGVSVDVANRRFTTTVILVQCAIVREGYPNGGSGGSGRCIY